MTDRKMATIRQIDEILPIPDADAIELAVVDGWKVVVKKNQFKVNDYIVYCEIDSWIPTEIASFLSKGKEPREYNGVKGERLRTVKLRGQVSQGLILDRYTALDKIGQIYVGQDVSELLNIQKYEPPVPACLAGVIKGNFPSFIPKTDQERCISGDTLIDTDQGKFTIKEIVDEKMSLNVYSYNHETNLIELKPIIDWSVMTRKNNWVKITFKSGKVLICTDNHKVWCEDILAYRNAGNLIISQKIIIKTD